MTSESKDSGFFFILSLDIEKWGGGIDHQIASIGACFVKVSKDYKKHQKVDEFYQNIYCTVAEKKVDPDCLKNFWDNSERLNPDIRRELETTNMKFKGGAANAFERWLRKIEDEYGDEDIRMLSDFPTYDFGHLMKWFHEMLPDQDEKDKPVRPTINWLKIKTPDAEGNRPYKIRWEYTFLRDALPPALQQEVADEVFKRLGKKTHRPHEDAYRTVIEVLEIEQRLQTMRVLWESHQNADVVVE